MIETDPAVIPTEVLGEELCRRRSSLGWYSLVVILGGVLLAAGFLMYCAAFISNSRTRTPDMSAGIALAAIGLAIIMLGFWLRAVAVYHRRGVVVWRKFRPPAVLLYDELVSISSQRTRLHDHHGFYCGTVVNITLVARPEALITTLNTESKHKERRLGKFLSFNRPFELVPQPDDEVIEIASERIAAGLLMAIERGERISFGDRIAADDTGILLGCAPKTHRVHWVHLEAIERPDGEAFVLRFTNGSIVPLGISSLTPNLTALAHLVPVLRARQEAADAEQLI